MARGTAVASVRATTSDGDGMDAIRRDVEAKCGALQAFAEEAALALRSELKVQLLKMPKKVGAKRFERARVSSCTL